MTTLGRAKALVTCTNGRGMSAGVNTNSIRADRKLLCLLFLVAAGIAIAHHVWERHFDFGIFYYAAHMVLGGARHALYDLPTQRAFQAKFHRPALPFCNAPFTLIPFLGVAKLPVEVAFIVWTLASLALLVFSVRRLAWHGGLQYGNWPILLSLAFMPIAESLGNGQLSIIVLTGYVIAYSVWRQGRSFLGGVALSLRTFKFQLVIGFVAVLLLKRKWRELLGFISGSSAFVSLSILIAGPRTLLGYPAFLRQGACNAASEPEQMASWRGLLWLSGGNHWIIIAALSLATILMAARLWRDLDTGFIAAVLAGMLVSYHFNLSDLSLFLIPALLAVRIGFPKEQLLRLALLALLIPEILAFFGGYFALLAIPLVLCLYWMWQRQRANKPRELVASLSLSKRRVRCDRSKPSRR